MNFWSLSFIKWTLKKIRAGLEWAWVKSFGTPLIQTSVTKPKTKKKKR